MVGIHAGDKVLMEFSTFGDRFLSVVTDVREDGSMLVYAPMPAPVIERLQRDRNVQVRYAHEGELRGFSSRVLNEVDSAETILILDRPRDTYPAEDRAEPRCVCSFPATVVEGNRAAQAVIEDMSKSCARIRFLNGEVPFLYDVGGMVRLTFHPFGPEDGQSVNCRVIKMMLKDNVRYAVLKYDPNENGARSRIASFIEAQVCCGIPRL